MLVKHIKEFALSTVSAMRKSSGALGKPVHLTIEPTNLCNLRCPVCETGAGILERDRGNMSLTDFKLIVDKLGECINTMFFYFMGEPFLNKEAYEMISYASQKGIYVATCTNGETVNAKELMESGIGEVSFQLGGMTQETHGYYRVRGDFRRIIDSLNGVVAIRRRMNGKTKITAGFIVMKHNEHEVGKFLDWSKTAGIDKAEVINPCVRDMGQGNIFLPEDDKYWFYNRELFNSGILRPKVVPHNRCWWIYYSTVITWDGNVLPCCRDAHGRYVMGNILEQSFKEIWNGARYREFRRAIANNQQSVHICRLCSGFGVPLLHR